MELRQYAETILFGPTLAEKLTPPGAFTDVKPGLAIDLPASPAREALIAFVPRDARGRGGLPSESAMASSPREVARLLTSFATHELLALELMALALLRFPDAPKAFRGGLAATMVDEQRHLSLYLDRIASLGGSLGEEPLSRFFWDACASVTSPRAFVARMSLTLEQANLDFALHYQALFHRIGDDETAALLGLVYRDEVRHVRHGHTWFERWRDPQLDDFTAYAAELEAPLTPSRARGIGFDAAGRRAAGLGESFIEKVAGYAHSKGRPPDVLRFNAACEDEIAATRRGGKAAQLSPAAAALAADLAGVMGFLAATDDVVLAPPPRPETANVLRELGYSQPQWEPDVAALAERKLGAFKPWGYSPAVETWLGQQRHNWRHAPRPPRAYQVFAKSHWAEAPARVCHGEDDLQAAWADLAVETVVLKAPFGASGRHMRKIARGTVDTPLPAEALAWARRVIKEQGALVVEPWLDKLADLSVQIFVEEDGSVRELGVTRFLTDRHGRYLGHLLGRSPFHGLKAAARRSLEESDATGTLRATAQRVGQRLAQEGYAGPAGIDAFVYVERDAETGEDEPLVRLRPLVEVNPRLTMGRVALALGKRVHRTARGAWLILPLARGKALGFADTAAWVEAWRHRFPPRLKSGLLVDGVVFTTEPAAATAVITVMIVGEAWQELAETLAPGAISPAPV